MQVFWKVLSASGKFKWQTSQPIPVTASGTITAAQIAVSPNATCTIALQTLEQPDSLQIFAMEGNPTLPITAERALGAHCQPIGKVEAAEGQSVVQFLFQPQSAGVLLRFSQVKGDEILGLLSFHGVMCFWREVVAFLVSVCCLSLSLGCLSGLKGVTVLLLHELPAARCMIYEAASQLVQTEDFYIMNLAAESSWGRRECYLCRSLQCNIAAIG